MKRKVIIMIFITITIVLCGLYLHYENTKLQVSNYKIVQISDFHNNQSNTLTNDLIKEIEKQKPNIIVLTGDFIDSSKTNVEVAMNFIKKINTVAPIYYVSGNHEASVKSYTKIKEQLAENKVVILENKKEELKKAMEENLTALVGKIPGLLTLEFVACPFGSSTHDMALVSTFEKEEDISVYAKHPAHVAVADTYVRPFVTERACLDY